MHEWEARLSIQWNMCNLFSMRGERVTEREREIKPLTGSSISDSSVCIAAPLFSSRNLLNDSSDARLSLSNLGTKTIKQLTSNCC